MKFASRALSLTLFALSPVPYAMGQELLGPLAGVVDSQLIAGWTGGVQDGWYVLRNESAQIAEQTLVVNPGPPSESGRITSINVSLSSSEPQAAIGLLARSGKTNDSCIMEITTQSAAHMFCVIGGQYQDIATVPNAARMDGTDLLELVELPGAARFLVNGNPIGDIPEASASALGGEIGIMAYDRGVFGLADFAINDVQPVGGSESGLPPRGGAGKKTPKTPQPSDGGSSDTDARIRASMGPLADQIITAGHKEGWDLFLEGNFVVAANQAQASSERVYTMPVGPVLTGERITKVNVAVLPPDGGNATDFPKSAAGILIENADHKQSCLGEITGAQEALVMCFGEDGKGQEIGRLDGVVVGNGNDQLEYVERPDSGTFLLNGKVIAEFNQHPAMGGDVGILAYERGNFYFSDFSVSTAQPASADTSDKGVGPLPMFGDQQERLIGVYLGLTNGIFMHEFGHALIGELQLPATGPEEDAVDIFSALRLVEPTMYPSGDESIDLIGREVAIYSALPWYYGGMIQQETGEQTPWQDEHTGDLKRFRNVFCVIYGGNPGLYGKVAAEVGLDERTLVRCGDEFNKQNRAWRTILSQHTRIGPWHPEGALPADAPGAKIEVIFEQSRSRVGNFLIDAFSDSVAGFAHDLADTYALPRDLTVIYRDCDELNAWYDSREGTITMCYDLIEQLAVMISDVEMGTKDGVDVGSGTQLETKPATDTAEIGNAKGATGAFDELAEMGVPTTTVLFPPPYRGATPAIPALATLVTTDDVAALLGSGKPLLMIDTRGQTQVIPGTVSVPEAGRDGSLTDSFQSLIQEWLTEETANDKSLPIVFYGDGMQDRSSYNAALRAASLGWSARWYRGGTEAWQANGLPLMTQQ